jgi:hypothetical protein
MNNNFVSPPMTGQPEKIKNIPLPPPLTGFPARPIAKVPAAIAQTISLADQIPSVSLNAK